MEHRTEELARRLEKWATEELHFSTESGEVLTVEDAKKLCSKGLSGPWQFLVDRCRSPSTARTIRGNLTLHGLAPSHSGPAALTPTASTMTVEERTRLLKQRDGLQQEMKALQQQQQQLRGEIQQARNSVSESANRVKEKNKQLSLLAHRSALLQMHGVVNSQDLQQLEELSRRLGHLASSIRERSSKKETTFVSSSTSGSLESAAVRQIRDITSMISKFLEAHYQSKDSVGQKSSAQEQHSKQQIWLQTEKALDQFSSPALLDGLQEVAREHAKSILLHTQAIDLRKDANQLGFYFEQELHGGTAAGSLMHDEVPVENVLQTLQDLLQLSQLQHIQRFTATERSVQRASTHQKRQAEQLRAAESQLLSQVSSRHELIGLARTLLHTEVQLAGSSAALSTWRSFLQRVITTTREQQDEQTKLLFLHEKINGFSSTVEKKQALVQALIKHNASAGDRISEQQAEVQGYVSRSVTSHQPAVTAACAQLRDRSQLCNSALMAASLDRLILTTHTEFLGQPVCDLSINRLGNHSTSSGKLQSQLVQTLGFPLFKCGDGLLRHVADQQEEVTRLEQCLHLAKQALDGLALRKEHQQQVQEHVHVSSSRDHLQVEQVVPDLRAQCQQTTDALAKCSGLRRLLQDWWEQPAQFLVPWLQYEGRSMQQWYEQYLALAMAAHHHGNQ